MRQTSSTNNHADIAARVLTEIHRGQMHGGIPEMIRSDEAKAGRAVVRPGQVTWLPFDDWSLDTVVAIEENRVRLVLLNARRPGHGAFKRLVKRLRDAGLKPVVVAPMPRLAASLKRRGWRERISGGESIWYPRRRA